MLPLVSHGANLFNLCPFPDSSALYVQNWFPIQPFDHNFPVFRIVDPIKPPTMGYRGANCLSLCPFPDESTDVYQSWCQSVQPFDSFPRLLNVWPLTPPPPPDIPPGVLRGDLYLAYAHSQMNPQTWTKVGANRSRRLTASRDFWMCDPLKPPKCPLGSLRAICLAYIHSLMNMHMCTKFGANRFSRLTASQDFWICDPLKPPEMPPCVLRFNWFGIHSQMNLHMCAKFGVNRFGSFSWICVKLVRLLATGRAVSRKNTSKNNIYTSKIIIPAQTCRKQRH